MGQARATVESFYDLFPADGIDQMGKLFDPACISVMPGGAMNQEQHEAMGYAFKAAFPDARMVIDHAIESGDEIVVLGRFQGTHTGDMVGHGGTIPASGRDLDLRFIDYFKVVDGVIVDHQTAFDQMDLLG